MTYVMDLLTFAHCFEAHDLRRGHITHIKKMPSSLLCALLATALATATASNPHDGVPTESLGKARFTVMSNRLIRGEYAKETTFDDR